MAVLSRTSFVQSLPRSARSFGFFELVALWQQRRALANMDAATLDDIGISHSDALAEADRPVWDVPAHWLQGSQSHPVNAPQLRWL